MTTREAFEKLHHTLCLNQLKFGIDQETHIDCESVDEMIECLEIVEKYLELEQDEVAIYEKGKTGITIKTKR